VKIAEWLKEKHPDEITIVIQNWFDGLKVTENDFTITLNFGDQLEEMTVPFKSIISFVDPSVEFGLKFDKLEIVEDDQSDEAQMIALEGEEQNDAEIVSLDSFRK
ncbi:ClpXP protease specificity-enhancing factor SspB, partial [Paracoccaceae bacterium]|nr:ClpXP protease specificity-enhancing factor SspB [Paracoccaceae bacterium]